MRWSASYGYDAADSRAWQRISQDDPLNPGTLFDNTRSSLFAYDGLRRLTSSVVGALDFTGPDPHDPEIDPGTTRRTIAWDLDSIGNWAGHTTSTYDPPGTLDETVHADQRTDLRNELVGIDPGTPSDPQDDEAIISDPLGSVVADDDHFYEYDAWGRLVQVSERGSLAFDADGAIASGAPGQWLVHFTYDGLGRLIRTQRPRPGTGGQQPTEVITHQFYYDGVRRIQDVETVPVQASGGGPVPIGQQGQWSLQTRLGCEYIHSPGYVDEFVCSVDRFGAPSFILQDANYNVIALTDAAGAVLTQYTWDPYGQLIDEQRSSAPFADNAIGHQGLFFDRLDGDADDPSLVAGAHGVYYARNRTLSTRLGRWLQADPNGTGLGVLAQLAYRGLPLTPTHATPDLRATYIDGQNRNSFVGSSPVSLNDPFGLFDFSLVSLLGNAGVRAGIETTVVAGVGTSILYVLYQYRTAIEDAISEWGVNGFAVSRETAKKQMEGQVKHIELHLTKLEGSVGQGNPSPDDNHWFGEVRAALAIIERRIGDVGRRTGAEWQRRLDGWRERLRRLGR
ncbi:MAG: hypothetical protein H6811_01595 [Phycisphaeraceae bacterium]|nr:hypothetical protein [Phycisphaeraceae bacterium]